MKVETKQTTCLKISDIESLDPITVHIEDHEPGRGSITIQCYDKSWHSYWGGMGSGTVSKFFRSCDDDYLSNCLDRGIRSGVDDWEGFGKTAQKEVCKLRRESRFSKELSKTEARDLFDEFSDMNDRLSAEQKPGELVNVFGDQWWYSVPEKPNPDYQYLCRIVTAVQDALKTTTESKEAA